MLLKLVDFLEVQLCMLYNPFLTLVNWIGCYTSGSDCLDNYTSGLKRGKGSLENLGAHHGNGIVDGVA